MRRRVQRVQKERPSGITVHVTLSTEAIDFDAWAEQYFAHLIAADRKAQQQVPEAA
jgi:hypothetical protein